MFRTKLNQILAGAQQDLQKTNAYLLPIRLFIGIGWIRASLEKFTTLGWPNGTAVLEFFQTELTSGSVVFPFYKNLIVNLFSPNSLALSWIIMIGQLLVGLAILTGTLTSFALLWGIFMNINFIFAGQITPSAFYILIQTILFVSGVGTILGLDRSLSRKIPFFFLSAQPFQNYRFWRLEKACYLLYALIATGIAIATIPIIQDYGLQSVEDPAMLLMILSSVTGLTSLIIGLRIKSAATAYTVPNRRIELSTEFR